MAGDSPGRITHLLHRAATGDQDAEAAVVQALYAELHRLARRQMRRERRQITLQPTALVHEAFVRLMRGADGAWIDRVHFFAAASNAMRRILVDYARSRQAAKRGHGAELMELQEDLAQVAHSPETVLAIDAALHRLSESAPRQARIVEMRFFAGLTEEEVAGALDISSRTVKREWTKAKAFLYQRLQASSAG
jgi:RNA polymerase sigma-70 factor, ECF subfamily